MKNTAINTLTYTGVVTLSQYIGSKKVELIKTHNKGGAPLFDFLADCLIGDFATASAARPVKIMLLKYTDRPNESTTYESASGFIYLLTKPEKVYTDNGTRRVRYSFMIPADRVEKLGDFGNIGIGLYTATATSTNIDADNFAAFCALTGLSQNQLINASLVVDWELEFANSPNNV